MWLIVVEFQPSGRQFEVAAQDVTQAAARRVSELREAFADIPSTARALHAYAPTDRGWHSLHAGVAAGLARDLVVARSRLAQVAGQEELVRTARDLSALLDDHQAFVTRIDNTVAQARALLTLSPQ
jgi:hypothetical protein